MCVFPAIVFLFKNKFKNKSCVCVVCVCVCVCVCERARARTRERASVSACLRACVRAGNLSTTAPYKLVTAMCHCRNRPCQFLGSHVQYSQVTPGGLSVSEWFGNHCAIRCHSFSDLLAISPSAVGSKDSHCVSLYDILQDSFGLFVNSY